MASPHSSIEGPAPHNTQSHVLLFNNQSRTPAIVPDMQAGTIQYMGRPLLANVQSLEAELRRQHSHIQRFLEQWASLQQVLGINPERQLVSIDSDTEEVVTKAFIAQSHQEHVELHNIKQATNENIGESGDVRELDSSDSSKQVFVVDDTEMVAKWDNLRCIIENFAASYFWNYALPEQLTQDEKDLFESISPLYREFLGSKGEASLIFESVMWTWISRQILENPTMVWGKEVSEAAETLFKVGINQGEDYHAWRAQTGRILHGREGIDIRAKGLLRRGLSSTIEHFIPKETMMDKKRAVNIRYSLVEIVDKAIEFAVIFNLSRCLYRCEIVYPGQDFNPRKMDHNEEGDAHQIDLMVSPALVKYGNSRGQDYDQDLIIAKSCVCSVRARHIDEGKKKKRKFVVILKKVGEVEREKV